MLACYISQQREALTAARESGWALDTTSIPIRASESPRETPLMSHVKRLLLGQLVEIANDRIGRKPSIPPQRIDSPLPANRASIAPGAKVSSGEPFSRAPHGLLRGCSRSGVRKSHNVSTGTCVAPPCRGLGVATSGLVVEGRRPVLPIFASAAMVICMGTRNISLPDHLKSLVDEQVAGRGYGTSSEYIRELIRRDQDCLALRRLLLDGASSAPTKPVGEEYFTSLRDRVRGQRGK